MCSRPAPLNLRLSPLPPSPHHDLRSHISSEEARLGHGQSVLLTVPTARLPIVLFRSLPLTTFLTIHSLASFLSSPYRPSEKTQPSQPDSLRNSGRSSTHQAYEISTTQRCASAVSPPDVIDSASLCPSRQSADCMMGGVCAEKKT